MKKLFLLFSIVCCSFMGNAQQKVTYEEARTICAKLMASFTTSVSGAFKQGVSYDRFQLTVCEHWKPTIEGSNQLKAAYNFLSRGVSEGEIIKTYSGKEIAASLNFLSELNKKGIKSDGSELFGGRTGVLDNGFGRTADGCRWYQIWCHLQDFADWVIDNWPIIVQIFSYFFP